MRKMDGKPWKVASQREWYLKNREKSIANTKKWQQENPERHKERQRTWRLAHPEHTKAKNLSRRLQQYQLTPEQYEQMFENQESLCAICQKPEPSGRKLAVDHDHKTGKVRKLLCTSCNIKIGWIETLQADGFKSERYFQYLKDHKESSES